MGTWSCGSGAGLSSTLWYERRWRKLIHGAWSVKARKGTRWVWGPRIPFEGLPHHLTTSMRPWLFVLLPQQVSGRAQFTLRSSCFPQARRLHISETRSSLESSEIL